MIIAALLIQIILLSPNIHYKVETYNSSSLNDTSHELETVTPRQSNSISSLLRIGVMAPSYYLETNPPKFDPIAIGWNYDFRRNSLIYEALVQYDYKTGDLSPALATQWVVSQDGKHWTFDLHDNVIFHDGSKFNASSVKWNYDRILNPEHPAYVPPAPYISFHSIPFDFIEIKSEFRITIHLKEPFAAFIYQCSFIQIASPHSFNGSELQSPIGTGPYVLDSNFFNTTIQNSTFIRFPYYYQGLAPFKKIHHLSKEDFSDEISNHSVDIVFPFEVIYPDLKTENYWSLNLTQDKTFMELGFFNHQNKYLKDPKVRLAINYAINRQDFIEKTNRTEFSKPMTNLIPPGVDFHNASIEGFPYNVTKANNLLDEAGYPRGGEGYRFSLSLIGSENSHPEIIGEYLKAIGIWPWIELGDWAKLWREGRYDLLIFRATAEYDPDMYWEYLHSSGSFNTGMFNDSIIDALLFAGSQTPVRQEREYFYNQLQLCIQESIPYFYLTYNNNIFAIATNLTSFIFVNKVNQIYFKYSISHPTVNSRLGINLLDEQNLRGYMSTTVSDIIHYKNVEISDYPIYFPQADCIVTPLQQKLVVNITMSNNLNDILPYQENIQIPINFENINFQFRYYYDIEELKGMSHEELSLLQYNSVGNKWVKLKILESNSTFHFLVVKLEWRINLIRFNDLFTFIQIKPIQTFKLVPFFVIAIGGLMVSALAIVIYNFRKTKYIKGRIVE